MLISQTLMKLKKMTCFSSLLQKRMVPLMALTLWHAPGLLTNSPHQVAFATCYHRTGGRKTCFFWMKTDPFKPIYVYIMLTVHYVYLYTDIEQVLAFWIKTNWICLSCCCVSLDGFGLWTTTLSTFSLIHISIDLLQLYIYIFIPMGSMYI